MFRAADPTDYAAAKRMYLELLEAQTVAAFLEKSYTQHIMQCEARGLARGSVVVVKAKLVEVVHSKPGQVRERAAQGAPYAHCTCRHKAQLQGLMSCMPSAMPTCYLCKLCAAGGGASARERQYSCCCLASTHPLRNVA